MTRSGRDHRRAPEVPVAADPPARDFPPERPEITRPAERGSRDRAALDGLLDTLLDTTHYAEPAATPDLRAGVGMPESVLRFASTGRAPGAP
jgi:hypothetical protein